LDFKRQQSGQTGPQPTGLQKTTIGLQIWTSNFDCNGQRRKSTTDQHWSTFWATLTSPDWTTDKDPIWTL